MHILSRTAVSRLLLAGVLLPLAGWTSMQAQTAFQQVSVKSIGHAEQ